MINSKNLKIFIISISFYSILNGWGARIVDNDNSYVHTEGLAFVNNKTSHIIHITGEIKAPFGTDSIGNYKVLPSKVLEINTYYNNLYKAAKISSLNFYIYEGKKLVKKITLKDIPVKSGSETRIIVTPISKKRGNIKIQGILRGKTIFNKSYK